MESKKEELLIVINNLPEEKIQSLLDFARALTDQENSPLPVDSMHELLLTFVDTFTNTLYDISVEAERADKKVFAKRLTLSRKKISQAWEVYNIERSKHDI